MPSINKQILRNRIHGMLAGVAIGDALGRPVERMEKTEIAKLHGGAGITSYLGPLDIPLNVERAFKLGDTTDDWQLTRAVAQSLIGEGKFDLADQATLHLKELAKSTFGWGKGTIAALEDIREGRRVVGDEPFPLGKNKGSGNGVMMKISPLSAVQAITKTPMVKEVLELGKLTHPDMRARIAAVSVHRFLVLALNSTSLFLDTPRLVLMYMRGHLPDLRDIEWDLIHDKGLKHSLSSHMAQIDITSASNLINTAGVGFVAWETAAFTAGVYIRQPMNFSTAILEAVNAGGDTDTNASIVGALVGATIGYSSIPDKWKTIPVMEEVGVVARSLCDTFM